MAFTRVRLDAPVIDREIHPVAPRQLLFATATFSEHQGRQCNMSGNGAIMVSDAKILADQVPAESSI